MLKSVHRYFKRYYSFKKVISKGKVIVYKDGNRLGKRKTKAYLGGKFPKIDITIEELSEILLSKNELMRESITDVDSSEILKAKYMSLPSPKPVYNYPRSNPFKGIADMLNNPLLDG